MLNVIHVHRMAPLHVVHDLSTVQQVLGQCAHRFATLCSEVDESEGPDVMTAAEQVLIDKIKQLPPQRMAEVEDFVDFLRAREEGEQSITRAAVKASEASFARVWDNDEDAAYDRM